MKAKLTSSDSDSARERLVEAAIEQFGKNGLDGTSVREIAKEAGLNFALISYYFRGKEQLYQEILRGMLVPLIRQLEGQIGFSVKKYGGKIDSIPPDEARALLKKMLGGMLVMHLTNRRVLQLMRIMIREQTNPSEAFDIIYSNGLEEVHKTITALYAIATETNPKARETIIQAHMLLGQVILFTAARATICRRLGREELSKRDIQSIVSCLEDNIDKLCQPS